MSDPRCNFRRGANIRLVTKSSNRTRLGRGWRGRAHCPVTLEYFRLANRWPFIGTWKLGTARPTHGPQVGAGEWSEIRRQHRTSHTSWTRNIRGCKRYDSFGWSWSTSALLSSNDNYVGKFTVAVVISSVSKSSQSLFEYYSEFGLRVHQSENNARVFETEKHFRSAERVWERLQGSRNS